jgi:hypothetical protein
MITVSVFYLNKDAETVKAGEITWDGKAISVSDESSTRLKNAATLPIWLEGGRLVRPQDEPELFIRSLHLMYHGSYFFCREAVESKARAR